MRRFHRSRWIPVALVAVLLCVSLPSVAPVRADAPCGTWTTTIVGNDDRIAIDPFAGFQGNGCEVAYQIHDRAGSLTIQLPFGNISFSSQIAGYTLELNTTGTDNANVTALNGSAIPGIDSELHLTASDSGAKAKVTLDGSVTPKSLSIDMLLLTMNTILDAIGLPYKCVPYAYVYGLIVDYIPTMLKAAGYMLQFPPQLGNTFSEFNRVKDDVMKGMLQKLIDTVSSAAIGCLPEAAIAITKHVAADLLTGGLRYVLVAAHAAETVLLTSGFIVKDWVAHNRQHAMITLDYSPAVTPPTQGEQRPPKPPSNLQVKVASVGANGLPTNTVTWSNDSSIVQGYRIYVYGFGKCCGDAPPDATLPGNATSYTGSLPSADRAGGGKFCYYVAAYNEFGQTPPTVACLSSSATQGMTARSPAPPTNVQIASAGQDASGRKGWTITWSSDPATASNPATRFSVDGGFGPGEVKTLTTVPVGVTTYTDFLESGVTQRCYYVDEIVVQSGRISAGPVCT